MIIIIGYQEYTDMFKNIQTLLYLLNKIYTAIIKYILKQRKYN